MIAGDRWVRSGEDAMEDSRLGGVKLLLQEGRMGYNENYQDPVDMFEIHNSIHISTLVGML